MELVVDQDLLTSARNGEAKAWQPPYTGITDNDTGSNSDNTGYGRGGNRAVSDNDSGPNADPAGHGRRC